MGSSWATCLQGQIHLHELEFCKNSLHCIIQNVGIRLTKPFAPNSSCIHCGVSRCDNGFVKCFLRVAQVGCPTKLREYSGNIQPDPPDCNELPDVLGDEVKRSIFCCGSGSGQMMW